MNAVKETKDGIKRSRDLGFPGAAAPWAGAQSYAYCVSVRLTIDRVARLTATWRKFFADLGLQLDVRVLDWRALKAWLDSSVRLIDSWVGLVSIGIIPHLAYLQYLDQFKKYLLEQHLGFVPPSPEARWHPKRLADRLISGTDGILLTGAGGAGKSRTLIEVANKLHELGWRVLHLAPTAQAIDVATLSAELLPGAADTLILADYVDRLHLDLSGIRRQLQPEARARKKRIAILASTRVSWLRNYDAERDELFQVVELGREERQTLELTAQILERVAPAASDQLGFERVAQICGQRPVIALLMAAELERRAHDRTLQLELGEFPRSSALVQWLQRRLSEDELIPPSASVALWAPESIPQGLLGAAAALACAPGGADTLAAAASACLDGNAEAAGFFANRIVGNLRRLGWLEIRRGALETAHDVVVDEVLTHVIRDGMSGSLRPDALETLLNASRLSPSSIGHFVSALSRVIDLFEGERFTRDAVDLSARWLVDQRKAIGPLVASERHYISAPILLALIASPFGLRALNEAFSDLLQPWLNKHSEHPDSWYVIYRCLVSLDEAASGRAVNAALLWLQSGSHRRRTSGSFLTVALLKRRDLENGQFLAVLPHALDWLSVHASRIGASFVLSALLRRPDLPAADAGEVASMAERWLSEYGETTGAPYVYIALMRRHDTSQECFERWLLTPHIWTWIQLPSDAKYKIFSILQSDRAHDWFARNVSGVSSGIAFRSQLLREDLDPAFASELYTAAIEWIQGNQETFEAPLILSAGLDRNDAPFDRLVELRDLAVRWIRSLPERSEVPLVLWHLLRTKQQLDADQAASVTTEAIHWLDKHPQSGLAAELFSRVLREDRAPSPIVRSALEHALNWLRSTAPDRKRHLVLKEVLGRAESLTADEVVEVLSDCSKWIAGSAPSVARGLLRLSVQVAANRLPEHAAREFGFGEIEDLWRQQPARTEISARAARSSKSEEMQWPAVVEVGSTIDGVVTNVLDYGYFVAVGRLSGFVHRTDIAWEWPPPLPKERIARGEAVRARVLSMNPEDARLSLGTRQLDEGRWLEVRSAYEIGRVVEATVGGKSPRGVVGVCRDGARVARMYDGAESSIDNFRVGDPVGGSVCGYDDDSCDVVIR